MDVRPFKMMGGPRQPASGKAPRSLLAASKSMARWALGTENDVRLFKCPFVHAALVQT